MKLFTLAVLGILLSSRLLFAQNENVRLLVQSPDGKTVKLIWFVKSWTSDITGFDIKRKEGLGDWVKLNAEPIIPEISVKSKLSAVEADRAEASRIKAKLFKLVADHKIKEIDHIDYLRQLNSSGKEAGHILDMMKQDYDIGLMSGFAFVDHSIKNKTDYQYGVFIQGTNKLLGKVSWDYGQVPDLNIVTEITSKGNSKAKGIRVMWNADTTKMISADVSGFNIYHEGIRLNQMPIICTNNNDASQFEWYDKSANTTRLNQYSISAESMFGIEGIIKSYTYNPAEHTTEYVVPKTTEILSSGYYFKDGISITWSFPVEFEKFLKGFYIEKNNMPKGYKRVSTILDPAARAYLDKTPSVASGYISMRVIAVYNDNTLSEGPARVYSYFSKREPPVPQNLKVKSTREDKKISIKLSWDPPMQGDTITDYYKIYASDSANERFYLLTENQAIKKNSYTYNVDQKSARLYRFYVSAVSNNSDESLMSDTVSLQLASLELPSPTIRNAFPDGNRVVIQWQYPAITDLKGFRLYRDKILIANEQVLTKDMREFRTEEFENGNAYEFTIVALAENNVESQVSKPIQVLIPFVNKK